MDPVRPLVPPGETKKVGFEPIGFPRLKAAKSTVIMEKQTAIRATSAIFLI